MCPCVWGGGGVCAHNPRHAQHLAVHGESHGTQELQEQTRVPQLPSGIAGTIGRLKQTSVMFSEPTTVPPLAVNQRPTFLAPAFYGAGRLQQASGRLNQIQIKRGCDRTSIAAISSSSFLRSCDFS